MKKQEVKDLIEARYEAAKKHLSGKDLSVYRVYLLCEPYFLKQGSFKKYLPNPSNNPKDHRNWKHFERCYELVQVLPNCKPEDYLNAVFTKSYDDQINKRLIYPSMLASEWAVNKYASWVKSPLRDKPVKSQTDMKGEAILASKRYVENFCKVKQITESEFFGYHSPGNIFPDSVTLIYTGVVSKLYASCSRSFWKMVEELDEDVKKEFLNPADFVTLKQSVRLDDKVLAYMRAALNEECTV